MLAEKEARYQAARERIFGSASGVGAEATVNADDGAENNASRSARTKTSSPAAVVKRAPRGPGERAGFGERTRGGADKTSD